MLVADRRDELTVVELVNAFRKLAEIYYVDAGGKQTTEYRNDRTLIARLRKVYGLRLVCEFGPLRFKAFVQTLIDERLSRTSINHAANRLRHIFKWGPTAVASSISAPRRRRFSRRGCAPI